MMPGISARPSASTTRVGVGGQGGADRRECGRRAPRRSRDRRLGAAAVEQGRAADQQVVHVSRPLRCAPPATHETPVRVAAACGPLPSFAGVRFLMLASARARRPGRGLRVELQTACRFAALRVALRCSGLLALSQSTRYVRCAHCARTGCDESDARSAPCARGHEALCSSAAPIRPAPAPRRRRCRRLQCRCDVPARRPPALQRRRPGQGPAPHLRRRAAQGSRPARAARFVI